MLKKSPELYHDFPLFTIKLLKKEYFVKELTVMFEFKQL